MDIPLVLLVILATTSCNPCMANTVKRALRTLFYVFGGKGIYLIDPGSKRVLSTIDADGVCTSSRRSRSSCSFGGAVVVKNELVFVSDSPGNRVHIIDIAKNKITETIPTEGYPYDLNYLPWLEEVWVHTWSKSTFDVIDTAGRVKKTHKAIKAHVQPGWSHGYLYADQKLKDGKVGYVTHLFNPGIHQLNLTTKSYKDFINMSSYNCTGTFHFVYSTVNKHGFVECYGSDEVIELNVSSDKVVRRWNFRGVPYISPDGRYVVSLYKKVNETLNELLDSKVFVLFITDKDSSPTLKPVINVPGGVSDLVFRQKANKPSSFFVFISLIYSGRIAVLDLDLLTSSDSSGKLTYIDGVGSVMSAPGMHAVGRPIIDGVKWIVSPATANDSVAVINAETRQLHGLVSGVIGGKRFAVVHSEESPHDSSGRSHPTSVISFAVLLYAVFIAVW